MKLDIAGVADLHGQLSHESPEVDVLGIVGDLVPPLSSAEDWKQWQELRWLETKGLRWLRRQRERVGHVIVVAGNHDILFMAPDTRKIATDLLRSEGIIVLDADQPHINLDGVWFSGYPYTPTIQQRRWAFSLPRGDARVEMALDMYVHPETDVLLSHGPPMGFLDGVPDGGKIRHAGCAMLTKKIIEVAPDVVMCGHIHEARGQRQLMWNHGPRATRVINVSLCDRKYRVAGAKVQTYEFKRGTE